MTSFALHHSVMSVYTGNILASENPQIVRDVRSTLTVQPQDLGKQGCGKYGKIQDGLEASVSIDGKTRITRVIAEIKQLSDVEKLLLYLKLPTGGLSDEHHILTPPSCVQGSNRTEQAQALTWIKSHLEEHGDVCLPKQEVYDDYKTYCENHGLRPLCNPDFGKMMKYAFPDIIARRLGKRGQSKYFYGGLRKKIDVAPPLLPELQVQMKQAEDDSKDSHDLLLAAGQVVCEWAQKLLEQSFSGLRELAEHLVSNLYVGSKSVAAFTVIAAMQETGNQNGKNSALFSAASNNAADKHRETQIQLQRKLQEKKLLEEQRRKMNVLRDENEQQLRSSSSLGRKTPLTPKGSARSSVSLDRKTPKISSTPSPLPLQSPRKFQTDRMVNQSAEFIQPRPFGKELFAQPNKEASVGLVQSRNTDFVEGQVDKISEGDKQKIDEKESELVKNELNKNSDDCVFKFPESDSVTVDCSMDESKTPEHCKMDTEEPPCHVRKIDFGEISPQSTETQHYDIKRMEEREKSEVETSVEVVNESVKKASRETISLGKPNRDSGIFSQSAGQLTLKSLLERKDLNENSLNKSLGFVSNRGTNLFASQNNNLSRSAFVPFSQSRKESIPTSITSAAYVASTSVPYQQTVHSSVSDSCPKSATITITPLVNVDQGVTNVIDPMSRPPDNIIHIQPGNTYHNEVKLNDDKYAIGQTPKSSSVVVSFTARTVSNGAEAISTTVTHKNMVPCSLASQDLKTLSLQISPGANKQIKTPRFTPIKPKSSPQKSSAYMKSSSDGPAYDNRPVSAILKEKREREKALGKVQASIQLPTIPLSGIQLQQVGPGLSLNPGQIGNVAPVTGEIIKLQGPCGIPTKDVVIFVNNSRAVTVPNVITPNQSVLSQLVPTSGTESTNFNGTKLQSERSSNVNESNDEKNDKQTNDLTERDSPSVEDIIFSPNSSNPSVETVVLKDENENSEISDLDQDTNDILTHESMEIERNEGQNASNSQADPDNIVEQNLDNLESQTPIKIAKLNVNSPFRPESACSLGRETPIKIMKSGELFVNRPESACSHGRETPSGGRKRKSSGNVQRNFKRLNSTGEVEDNEGSSVHDLGSNILDPQRAEIRTFNQRRTHSCTLELDKDRKQSGLSHNKSFTLDTVNISLQSPDITSLEREALIDAFPHTTCSIKPAKSHQNSAQKSSIGISSDSFRNALKLKKQQGYLNERVNTFLMRQKTGQSMATVKEQTDTLRNDKINGDQSDTFVDTHTQVSFNQNIHGRKMEIGSGKLELESDIPSDVADFINETIEKRESANNSVISEPGFTNEGEPGYINPMQVSGKSIENIKADECDGSFVTDHGKLPDAKVMSPEQKTDSNKLNFIKTIPKQGKMSNDFTVPKVPPFNFRLRENNIRFPNPNPDIYSQQQRCSSLPTFTSPVRSPVSPVNRQAMYQRSSSISPGVAPSPDREISKISQGVLRKVEVRENHPISVSIHPNSADDGTFVRPNSLPIRIAHHEERCPTTTTSYLASLQHNLQKPVDQRGTKQKDSPIEKPSNITSPVSRGQFSREPSADRLSFTPFSDRGYHSIGNSPILNSTPVSLSEAESFTLRQSPRQDMPTGIMLSPQNQFSQAPLSSQLTTGTVSSTGVSVINVNQLNSSMSSAFIPIQGSSNEIRYVTPIRPMATVACEKSDNPISNTNNNGQEIQNAYLNGKLQAPPPYEFAVQQLRKSANPESTENIDPNEIMMLDQNANIDDNESLPLLANMGQTLDDVSLKQMGPCSSRLAQLSRQSKQFCSIKLKDSHPSIMTALNEPAKNLEQIFLDQQHKVTSDLQEANSNVENLRVNNLNLIPSNFGGKCVMNIQQQTAMDSGSLGIVPQAEINVPDSDQILGDSKNTISSLTNLHSNLTAQEFDANVICSQNKLFDPSINVISTGNVLQSRADFGKFLQTSPGKINRLHARRPSFPSNVCTFGQNSLQEDTYQEMSRNEFTTAELDPLGNTLEDLKEILSDKSSIQDSGLCGEADVSANEEGFGQLLFGDE